MRQHKQTVFFLEQLQPDWLVDRRRRLLFQLVGGLFGGLLVGLVFLQHFALRFWLWRTGLLPWNLVAFLDEAAERLLLRKVGGGYIFIHRLLLDHLASLEKKEF